MYVHAQGIAFRPPVTAGVAVFADQLFPLGINRDHGLAGGPGRKHLGIDVLELGRCDRDGSCPHRPSGWTGARIPAW
jgi:hypothetical protein